MDRSLYPFPACPRCHFLGIYDGVDVWQCGALYTVVNDSQRQIIHPAIHFNRAHNSPEEQRAANAVRTAISLKIGES